MRIARAASALLLGLLLSFSAQAAVVATTLVAQPELSRFTAALKATGLDARLRQGQWTVFAPADSAPALPPPPYRAQDLPALRNWLEHHLVPGRVLPASTSVAQAPRSLAGSGVQLQGTAGQLVADDAPVRGAAVQADNGLIYVLTQPLLPFAP